MITHDWLADRARPGPLPLGHCRRRQHLERHGPQLSDEAYPRCEPQNCDCDGPARSDSRENYCCCAGGAAHRDGRAPLCALRPRPWSRLDLDASGRDASRCRFDRGGQQSRAGHERGSERGQNGRSRVGRRVGGLRRQVSWRVWMSPPDYNRHHLEPQCRHCCNP